MARPLPDSSKIIVSQVDFTAGELDPEVKRGDSDPDRKIELALKTGGRQMSNWRILNNKKLKNRPGRRALFLATVVRIEEIVMLDGSNYYLGFGQNNLFVYNNIGTLVFSQAGMPWQPSNVNLIVWAQYHNTIWIAFQNTIPQILTWDGTSTWALTNFAENITAGGQKRTMFYRISPKDITMQPSATTGNITLDFSSAIAVAGMVGTRMRYANRQILITGIVSSSRLNGTVIEPLPIAQVLTVGTDPRTIFNLGDVVLGSTSGANGVVTVLTATTMTVQLLTVISAVTQSHGGGGG